MRDFRVSFSLRKAGKLAGVHWIHFEIVQEAAPGLVWCAVYENMSVGFAGAILLRCRAYASFSALAVFSSISFMQSAICIAD